MSGSSASCSETAPRSPTQPMKVVSSRVKRNGHRHAQIATGRATKMRNAARPMPWMAMTGNSDGVANRPNTTNIAIWASQVMPSWKRRSVTASRSRRLPA